MYLIALLITGIACLGQLSNASLSKRAYKYSDSSCSNDQKKLIDEEMDFARQMVQETMKDATRFKFYQTFFPKSSRDDPSHKTAVAQVFKNSYNMLNSGSYDHDFTVTCDATTKGCSTRGWMAHFNSDTNVMNFCSAFFDPNSPKGALKSTQANLDNCRNLNLRDAQWSRSAAIIHETMHSAWVMETKTQGKFNRACRDYAYGFNRNYQLPLGEFDRSCAPWVQPGDEVLCPDPNDPTKEGICDEEFANNNADTFSFVAAGVFFSVKCGATGDGIPMPDPPAKPKLKARQRPDCPDDDFIEIDGPDD